MGRTQVLRNQRLGRPGQKGRGRTETTSSLSSPNHRQQRQHGNVYVDEHPANNRRQRQQQQQQKVDSQNDNLVDGNSIATAAATGVKLDDQLLALESHGNYYGSSSIRTSDYSEMCPTNTFLGTLKEAEIERIDQGLSTLSLRQILDLPLYLTESMEDQSRHVIGATLRRIYHVQDDSTANPAGHDNDDDENNGRMEETKEVEERSFGGKIPAETYAYTTPTSDHNDEEEDMESWLDSMIS